MNWDVPDKMVFGRRVAGGKDRGKVNTKRGKLFEALAKGNHTGNAPTMIDLVKSSRPQGQTSRGSAPQGGGGMVKSRISGGGLSTADPLEGQIDAEARKRFGDKFYDLARQRSASEQMDVNRENWFNEYRNRIAQRNSDVQNAYQQARQGVQALNGLNTNESGTDFGAAAMQQRQNLANSYAGFLEAQRANQSAIGANRGQVADLQNMESQSRENARKRELSSLLSKLQSEQIDWKTARRSDMEAAAAKADLERAILGNDVQKNQTDAQLKAAELKAKAADRAAERASRKADKEAERQLKAASLNETSRHNKASESIQATRASKPSSSKDDITPKEIRKNRKNWFYIQDLVKRDMKANGARSPKEIAKSLTENDRFKADPILAEAAAALIQYGGVLKPTAKRLHELYGIKVKVRRTKPLKEGVGEAVANGVGNLFSGDESSRLRGLY